MTADVFIDYPEGIFTLLWPFTYSLPSWLDVVMVVVVVVVVVVKVFLSVPYDYMCIQAGKEEGRKERERR